MLRFRRLIVLNVLHININMLNAFYLDFEQSWEIAWLSQNVANLFSKLFLKQLKIPTNNYANIYIFIHIYNTLSI